MKTYESEFEELWQWFMDKSNEYIALVEAELKSGYRGLDSILDLNRKKDVKEYNRRLEELKKKYNRT